MSWVIVDIKTGKGVYETWQKSVTLKVNTEKYKVVPILDYLYSLNGG